MMTSLRVTFCSLGFLMAASSVSLPAGAAPQLEETVPSASRLGQAITALPTPLVVQATPSSKLIDEANNQLKAAEAARRPSSETISSFQWQSELRSSQRRSDPGYLFSQSKF